MPNETAGAEEPRKRPRAKIDPEIKKELDEKKFTVRVVETPRERDRRTAMGRVSYFHEAFLDMAYKAALMGATDEELAMFFEVSRDTITLWKDTKPGFKDAIAAGKWIADSNVVKAIYKKACGYSHPAVKIFYNKDTGEVVEVPYTQYYPPDTEAAKYWLSHRQREKWNLPAEATTQVNFNTNGDPNLPAPTIVINPIKVTNNVTVEPKPAPNQAPLIDVTADG